MACASQFFHGAVGTSSQWLALRSDVVSVSAVASQLQNAESTRHVFLVNFSHMILDSKNNQNCAEELQHFQYCICFMTSLLFIQVDTFT